MIFGRGFGAAVERELTPAPERKLAHDPVEWLQDDVGEHPWSMQRKVMRSVVVNRRTAVPSAHGTGKSFTGSRLAGWWISAHPPGEAVVVTTAPSQDQVKGIIWREISKLHVKADLPGRLVGMRGSSNPEWYIGETRVAFGRKPQDVSDPNQARQAFQGIHERYVLVIIDEATGVPEWLKEAAMALLTNESARVLAIGNPDDPSTWFAEACKPGSAWNVIPVSAYDTPAFTGEQVPERVLEGLVSKKWVEEALIDYGSVDNPLFQSKVLGIFPDTSDRNVISPRMIREAQGRDMPGIERGAFGLDVSRSPTGDWTELYRLRGGVARLIDRWRGLDEIASAERAWKHVGKTPAVPIVVDADGLGHGTYAQLVRLGARAKPFTLNTPPHDPVRFDTRRSEVWWEFRELMATSIHPETGAVLRAAVIDLDPEDGRLAAQLQTPRWWLDSRGRTHVETKKEMAKRGVVSPDAADAVIMAALDAPVDVVSAAAAMEHARLVNARAKTPEERHLALELGELRDFMSRPM